MFNTLIFLTFLGREQPPSGGCVLKLWGFSNDRREAVAATFGWLCVETYICPFIFAKIGSHLRVAVCWNAICLRPPTHRKCSHLRVAVCWNSVSTRPPTYAKRGSHLRVAVCWNMSIETEWHKILTQPPSGGCVLKHFATRPKFSLVKQPPSGGCVLKLYLP